MVFSVSIASYSILSILHLHQYISYVRAAVSTIKDYSGKKEKLDFFKSKDKHTAPKY